MGARSDKGRKEDKGGRSPHRHTHLNADGCSTVFSILFEVFTEHHMQCRRRGEGYKGAYTTRIVSKVHVTGRKRIWGGEEGISIVVNWMGETLASTQASSVTAKRCTLFFPEPPILPPHHGLPIPHLTGALRVLLCIDYALPRPRISCVLLVDVQVRNIFIFFFVVLAVAWAGGGDAY